jgi:hypothetical protein
VTKSKSNLLPTANIKSLNTQVVVLPDLAGEWIMVIGKVFRVMGYARIPIMKVAKPLCGKHESTYELRIM